MSIGNKNKSDLNLYCQKARIPNASYTSSMQEGSFVSKVCVNGNKYSSTSGYSTKKEAENDAAGVALIAILQKEFSGKTIEEVLAILEQKHPSKNKKKSKQASSVVSETQVHKDVERSGVQMDTTSSTRGQIGGHVTQHSVVTQEALVASSVAQNLQSQVHNVRPQGGVVRPVQTQTGANQAVYHHHHQQQATVMPPCAVAMPQLQQGGIRPSQAYIASYSQQHSQTMQQGQAIPMDTGVAPSQGDPKGGGGLSEQVQRTSGQLSATAANFYPVSQPLGHSQAPPTQVYAPPTAPYHQVQYPPISTAVYDQQYAYDVPYPHMQPNYMYQAPPTGGGQWVHPRPHLINYPPPQGVYPPPPGLPTVTPTCHGSGVRVAPPPGMRSMAARFPGVTPPPPPQQLPRPPPPGHSAHQSDASPPQITTNRPLNAIPVTHHPGQGLPHSSAQQDVHVVESSSRSDTSKSTEFNHTKMLEELCKANNLPAPFYSVKQDKEKYSAEVKIGERLYHTQWMCDHFEQAKSIAAMEAITDLAMSMNTLSVRDTGNQQQSESSGSSAANTSRPQTNPNTSPVTSSTPPTQTTKSQSLTQNQQPSKQQLTQSSLGQQPITSPSNTTTIPPPAALQPPSFFTNNSQTPPTSTAQTQPKAAKQDPQPKAKTMSAVNYKQVLNIHCQRNRIPVNYECSASEDAVGYIAVVKISGKVFESSPHGTKKAAEIEAAERAVKALGLVDSQGGGEQKAGSGYGQQGRNGHTQQVSAGSQAQNAGMVSYKNLLQEHMQKQGLSLPHYETERVELGFKSTVRVHRHSNDSVEFTSGPQPVKKAAEQEAAKTACIELKLVH